MSTELMEHPAFRADYARLAEVSLDPARHSAPDARAHCEMVAARVEALAQQHGCTPAERARLVTLARVHDIGKLDGDARPAASVERLEGYGVDDPELLALVKVHDTNLPWWQSWRRGQAPGDKAWRRLAARVDMRLLALFMIADRVDAPGGWRSNEPLMWFLEQATERGLLSLPLDPIDPVDVVESERCAGAMLVRPGAEEAEVLLIRVRASVWELPKGHIEPGERADQAAERELREESGVVGPVELHARIGSQRYSFRRDLRRIDKHVEYFTFYGTGAGAGAPAGSSAGVRLGPRPDRTKERRWVSASELASLPLVCEDLRSLIADGFALVSAHAVV